MIFATVGTQLPFDRLVEAVDRWAGANPAADVFMQIGASSYRPVHCRYQPFVHHRQWEQLFAEARCVVSHAGMGTALQCLEHAKPLVILPRLAARGEHRTDHQLATAAKLERFASIRVARDADELAAALDQPGAEEGAFAETDRSSLLALLGTLRSFVSDAQAVRGGGVQW